MSLTTTPQLTAPTPYVLDPGSGHPLSWFSSGVTLKASTGPIGAVEVVMAPGDEPPMHVHRNEDEWFYVMEGELTFLFGDESMTARRTLAIDHARSTAVAASAAATNAA